MTLRANTKILFKYLEENPNKIWSGFILEELKWCQLKMPVKICQFPPSCSINSVQLQPKWLGLSGSLPGCHKVNTKEQGVNKIETILKNIRLDIVLQVSRCIINFW